MPRHALFRVFWNIKQQRYILHRSQEIVTSLRPVPDNFPEQLPTPGSHLRNSLLKMRLDIPELLTQVVPRERLVDLIQQHVTRWRITLLVAAAGSGKSTALKQWFQSKQLPVAYLPLEERENEPVTFVDTIIASLQTLDPAIGKRTEALLEKMPSVKAREPIDLFLTDLHAWAVRPFVLVLDDVQKISSSDVLDALKHLINYMPREMHVLLVSRIEPPHLPLTTWKSEGKLSIISPDKLHFTLAEAEVYFALVEDPPLSRQDIQTLFQRTEGHIGLLQLAAMYLRENPEGAGELADFQSNLSEVQKYLTEAVFANLPTQDRDFLLKTSILDQFSASLCDAVRGQSDSQDILRRLETTILFLHPQDRARRWYRYHRLFGDFLYEQLKREMPEVVPELHQRACQWYEEHRFFLEAIQHIMLASDLTKAAYLLDQRIYDLSFPGPIEHVKQTFDNLLCHLQKIPSRIFQDYPRLYLFQAFLHYSAGEHLKAHAVFSQAEQTALPRLSEHRQKSFLCEIGHLRAYTFLLQGNFEQCLILAREVANNLDQAIIRRIHLSMETLIAYEPLLRGDGEQISEEMLPVQCPEVTTGNRSYTMDVYLAGNDMVLQASLLRMRGYLRQARQVYERMMQMQGTLIHPACYQRTIKALGTMPEEYFHQFPRLGIAQALLVMSVGQLPEALACLQRVKDLAAQLLSESAQQVVLSEANGLHAYILLLQGDLEGAVELARQAMLHAHKIHQIEVREAIRLIAAHLPLVTGDARLVDQPYRVWHASEPQSNWDAYTMDVFLHLSGLLLHARLLRLQRQILLAAAIYERMLHLPGQHQGLLIHPGACFGLGEYCYACNELARARPLLEQGKQLLNGPLMLSGDAILRGYATLALLHQAQQRPDMAHATLDEFTALARARHFAPLLLKLTAAYHAWLALLQGNLPVAIAWSKQCGLSAQNQDEPVYSSERACLIYTRVLLAWSSAEPASFRLAEARQLLENLRADAAEKQREESLFEILILLALAYANQAGPGHAASPELIQALQFAERTGVQRIFLDEGQPMEQLLRAAQATGITFTTWTIQALNNRCGQAV